MINAGDIIYHARIDNQGVEQGMSEGAGIIDSHSSGIGASMQTIGSAATVAGGLITGALGGLVYGWASAGDELDKMSGRTGISTEALSEMKFVMEQNGASLSTFEMAQRNATRAIDAASDGTGAQAEALQRLGLDYETLRNMSPEDQFKTIAFAIGEAGDHTDQAALAMEMFGSRVGTQLLPMIKNGEEGFEALRLRAHELGIVMDEEGAAKAAAFTDTMNELKMAFQGAMITIGPMIADVIIPFVQRAIEAAVAVTEWMSANEGMMSVIVPLVAAVGAFLLAVGMVVKIVTPLIVLVKAVGVVLGVVAGVISGPVILAIAALVAAGAAIFYFWDEIVAAAKVLWEGLKAAFEVGSEIITALFTAWFESQKMMWDIYIGSIVAVATMLWDGVVAIYEWGAGAVSAVWDGIVAGAQMAIGIVASLIETLAAPFQWLLGMIASVGNLVGGGVPGVPSPDGARAEGGPVRGGRSYLVGEQGPELFTPRTGGFVHDAQSTQAMAGAGAGGININISGVTLSNDMDVSRLAQRLGEEMRQRLTGIGARQGGRR